MQKQIIVAQVSSTALCDETQESFTRLEIQRSLQHLPEAESTELLGRGTMRARPAAVTVMTSG